MNYSLSTMTGFMKKHSRKSFATLLVLNFLCLLSENAKNAMEIRFHIAGIPSNSCCPYLFQLGLVYGINRTSSVHEDGPKLPHIQECSTDSNTVSLHVDIQYHPKQNFGPSERQGTHYHNYRQENCHWFCQRCPNDLLRYIMLHRMQKDIRSCTHDYSHYVYRR